MWCDLLDEAELVGLTVSSVNGQLDRAVVVRETVSGLNRHVVAKRIDGRSEQSDQQQKECDPTSHDEGGLSVFV
jgi:hypothetical protein